MTLFDTISKYFPRRYTRQILPDMTGTICVPWRVRVDFYSGADFYKISSYDPKKDCFNLEYVENLEPGMPYIFKSTGATELKVWHWGKAVEEPGNYNGFYGTFHDMQGQELEGKYLMTADGKFTKADGKSSLSAYRGYMDVD